MPHSALSSAPQRPTALQCSAFCASCLLQTFPSSCRADRGEQLRRMTWSWNRSSPGTASLPPQITSFEPPARPPDSFRKPRRGDLILFSQILLIRNEGRLLHHSRGHDRPRVLI